MKSYQQRCFDWALDTFERQTVESVQERTLRFFEESSELVQTVLTYSDAKMILDRVYSRPPEQYKYKEIGGVLVTLAVLCSILDVNMEQCGEMMLDYCEQNKDKIRESHAKKIQEGIAQ